MDTTRAAKAFKAISGSDDNRWSDGLFHDAEGRWWVTNGKIMAIAPNGVVGGPSFRILPSALPRIASAKGEVALKPAQDGGHAILPDGSTVPGVRDDALPATFAEVLRSVKPSSRTEFSVSLNAYQLKKLCDAAIAAAGKSASRGDDAVESIVFAFDTADNGTPVRWTAGGMIGVLMPCRHDDGAKESMDASWPA